MTNLLLMADDEDADLGDFFRLCAEKVKEHASSLEQCECKIFPSNKLRTNIMLHYCIDTFDSQSFVCGAFMHGNETSLLLLCLSHRTKVIENLSRNGRRISSYRI